MVKNISPFIYFLLLPFEHQVQPLRYSCYPKHFQSSGSADEICERKDQQEGSFRVSKQSDRQPQAPIVACLLLEAFSHPDALSVNGLHPTSSPRTSAAMT